MLRMAPLCTDTSPESDERIQLLETDMGLVQKNRNKPKNTVPISFYNNALFT